MEREALAIKWALQELCYYLLGRRFTLVTDQAPLQWMARAKDSNARITRWFLSLQDFCFDVSHRSGKQHGKADGLSRLLFILFLAGHRSLSTGYFQLICFLFRLH